MTTRQTPQSEATPSPPTQVWLGGRRGLLILAAVIITVGLATNWTWLAAIGVAPVIIALAPCALMCGLGFCMMRCSGKSCSPEGSDGSNPVNTKTGES